MTFQVIFLQFALIASLTRIDTESDRWDPPISAKLAKKNSIYADMDRGPPVCPIKNKKGKNKKAGCLLLPGASHRASTSGHPCRPAAILPLPHLRGSPPMLHLRRISSPCPSPADILPCPIPGQPTTSSGWRRWGGMGRRAPGSDIGEAWGDELRAAR
jgi:hypothetical protein